MKVKFKEVLDLLASEKLYDKNHHVKKIYEILAEDGVTFDPNAEVEYQVFYSDFEVIRGLSLDIKGGSFNKNLSNAVYHKYKISGVQEKFEGVNYIYIKVYAIDYIENR